MSLIRITCSRCLGSGNFSFNLTRGTVCFQCNGDKTVLVDSVKEAKRLEAKRIRSELAKSDMDAKVAVANQAYKARVAKYQNDSRIGHKTKVKCEQFEEFANQTYKLLEDIDNGTYKHGHSSIAE